MGFGDPYPWVFVDGAFVPADEARVGVLANALSYGTGTFEGIRASGTGDQVYLFQPRAHFARLTRSARILGLPLAPGPDDLVAATVDLLRRNEVRADAYVRPLLFLAQERLFVRMHDIDARLVIAATPMPADYLPVDGLRCMTSSWRRAPDTVLPARAKVTGGYVGPALAKTEALRAGYDEAVMLTVDGYVAESTTANVVIRSGHAWFSPLSTDDVLAGITLRCVATLLGTVEFRRVQRSELYAADEVFLCGTAALVAPVVSVDGRPVGDGRPGERSLALRDELRAIARREVPQYPEWTVPVYG